MKNTESAVRSRARRRGYALVKSRRNGTYGLLRVEAPGGHWRSRLLVLGDSSGYGCSLDEVADQLAAV